MLILIKVQRYKIYLNYHAIFLYNKLKVCNICHTICSYIYTFKCRYKYISFC
nr:MAG TPA: His-Me finger endonuclease beta4-alpha2 domain [Caudoviricetes sp.]